MDQQTQERKIAVDGAMRIPCKSSEFIEAWLEVMRPIHRLSPKEIEIAAAIIKKRNEFAQSVSDKSLINKLLFNKETKESIVRETNITMTHFKTILHKLRDKGLINGNMINPIYLPDWSPGRPFRWMFIFENEL